MCFQIYLITLFLSQLCIRWAFSPQTDEETKAWLSHLLKVTGRVKITLWVIILTKLGLTYALFFVCLDNLFSWHKNICEKSKSKQANKQKEKKKKTRHSAQFALCVSPLTSRNAQINKCEVQCSKKFGSLTTIFLFFFLFILTYFYTYFHTNTNIKFLEISCNV